MMRLWIDGRVMLTGLLAAFAIIVGYSVFASAEVASANDARLDDDRQIGTQVTVDPPPAISVGETPYVVARLTTATGNPLPDASVELYLAGQFAGRTRTDAAGVALLSGGRQSLAGELVVTVIFYGERDNGLRPSSAETILTVAPIRIEIETVPALPQVRFAIAPIHDLPPPWGDRPPAIVETDSTGLARIDLNTPGLYRLEVMPWEGVDPEARAEFARWLDEAFVPQRIIVARAGLRLQVGFLIHYRVDQSFVDLSGEPIDPDRISTFQIKSSIGERRSLDDGQPRWLAGVRVSRRSNGLEAVDIVYRIETVTLDGVEGVVNRNQQAFTPRLERHWSIELLTFSAEISARDAFFGTPVGTAVLVEYPTGDSITVPFDENGMATIDGLPRGEYRISVLGGGYSPPRPVAMTRNQEMALDVISRLDMAFAVGLVGAVGFGLLLIGRPGLVLVPLQYLGRLVRLLTPSRRNLDFRRATWRWRPPPAGWILGLLLCLTSVSSSVAAQDAVDISNTAVDVPVLAYYYAWFDPASWDRAKIDYPLLGRYSSDDRAIMEQHVQWAKAVGIDGFIISWKDTEILTRRLELLVEVAEDEDFKLAIVIQGLDVRRQPRPPAAIGEDLDFFITEFGTSPVFDLFARPLVIWSGTWEFSRDEIAEVTKSRRKRLFILATERNAGAYQSIADLVDGDAYYWSSVNPQTYPGYPEKLTEMAAVVRANGGLWIAPAAPGFDARLVGGVRVVERLDGETLRAELAAAASSSPDAIGLISWNEFSENTHVEPSCVHGVLTIGVLAEVLNGTAPTLPATIDGCIVANSPPSGSLPPEDSEAAPVEIGVTEFAPLAAGSDDEMPRDGDSEGVLAAAESESDFDSSSPGGTVVRPWNLLILGGLCAATILSLAVIGARGRRDQDRRSGDAPLSPGDAEIGLT